MVWYCLIIISCLVIIINEISRQRVELPKQVSNGNAHQECFDRISRVAEIEDVQAPHELPVSPLCIKVSNIFK